MAGKKSKKDTRKNRVRKLAGKKLDAAKTLRAYPPTPC
jgi:hypothetical protein